MFGLASGVYQSYFAPPKLSILIVGLDGSGKTALLERIKVTNISTQLDVTASSLPPSYPTGAVLVSGKTDDFVADGAVGNNNNGRKHTAGTPARLPPPLPSKKAAKGRKFVDKVTGSSTENNNNNLEGGTTITNSSRNGNDEVESKINEAARLFISSDVPPPPFDMSENIIPSRPPLPTNNNVKRKNVTSAHQNDNNMRSSLRNMLRCPSPQKYTMAAMGGEEDDEYLDEHDVAESSTVSSQSNNDDNVNGKWEDEDYLKDYHIDYNETQQFDIKNSKAKMFPLDKIRPTLGQNLAKLDMCGCKCSIFDLSGAEKMRPLWERYYRDADAIVYVVNCADTSLDNLEKSRSEFEQMCQNDVIERHCRAGLPILIFANQIDLAYREYGEAIAVNNESNGNTNGIKNSWNADDEDDFVGGPGRLDSIPLDETDTNAGRALEFHDLAALFGLHNNENNSIPNLFLFGGSAKSGEGVRASMEVLMAHAKRYHLGRRK